jgi:hypothetical protein
MTTGRYGPMSSDPYAAIKALFAEAGSHIFVVKFFKVDGTERTMTVQMKAMQGHFAEEIAPGMKEAIAKRKENNPHLLTVWDLSVGDFRFVNMNTLYEVHMNGSVYYIDRLKPVKKEG